VLVFFIPTLLLVLAPALAGEVAYWTGPPSWRAGAVASVAAAITVFLCVA
jgi:hypothetical protein